MEGGAQEGGNKQIRWQFEFYKSVTPDVHGQRNARKHPETHGKLWIWKYYEFLLSQYAVHTSRETEQGTTFDNYSGTSFE